MDAAKKNRLEAAGFKSVTRAQFLELTPAQEAIVEIKGVLSDLLVEARERRGWTQRELAELLDTKQAGIARLESGIGPVSLDAMVKALFAAGVQMREIADAIGEIEFSVEEPLHVKLVSTRTVSARVKPSQSKARPALRAKPKLKPRQAVPA